MSKLRTKLKNVDHDRKRRRYLSTRNRYKKEVGSTEEVGKNTAYRTVGWVTKNELVRNKRGTWVIKSRSITGKRLMKDRKGIWAKLN